MIDGLKPYPEMKPSHIEGIGDVPSHWSIVLNQRILKEQIRPHRGQPETQLSLSQRQGLVPTKSMEERSLQTSSFDSWKVTLPGDLVLNRFKAHLGVFFASTLRGIVSFHYGVFAPRVPLSSKYFEFLFHTPAYRAIYGGRSNGMTVGLQNLSNQNFYNVHSIVPPIEEQSAIVRFLDHSDRRIRRCISAKKKLIALLNEQKQAIIRHAMTRGIDRAVRLKPSGVEWLGDVPEQWAIKRLKWVNRLQRGYDLPAERRIAGAVPVISSGGIIGKHSEARSAGPGVVMGRYGSTDAVYYIDVDFWPHNTALYVTDFQRNRPRWSYYLLCVISKADHSGKSAVPGIDRKDIYQTMVAVPPVDMQEMIVRWIEKESAGLGRTIIAFQREIALLQEYRTRLITDVVTGKLDVREAAVHLPNEADEAIPEDELDALATDDGTPWEDEAAPDESEPEE